MSRQSRGGSGSSKGKAGGIAAVAVLLLAALWWGRDEAPQSASALVAEKPGSGPAGAAPAGRDPAAEAFARGARGEWMHVEGVVDRLLADDNDGSRHQRFILRTSERHTVLVAHNIDLAPRLEGLREGEVLSLRGEYEWNDRGGLIHWTHHDPQRRLRGGYIDRQGRRYE